MGEVLRIGVDVGGTNTDAVLLRGRQVLAAHKAPTTQDVGSGIVAAIEDVLQTTGVPPSVVCAVMIGTTHFTNALIEARHLCKVGVLRLGAPATLAIRPMVDWPVALREAVCGHTEIVKGGFNYDGRPITPLDRDELRRAAREFAARGLEAVAISSVFAPVNTAQEQEAAELVQEQLPGARIALSSQIGRIGLIERENAAIMNAALLPMAERVVQSFRRALADLGLRAPFYVSQNDGTLLDPDVVARYPVLTFASGPTNSMRGAAFLSGMADGLVMDIGGTTTDVGVLVQGFPRESSVAVDIGAVRTNFRMPDLLSIGLGGGSLVTAGGGRVQVGPRSVGYRIAQESMVFGGSTLTATDIAVAAGYADIGDRERVAGLDRRLVAAAMDEIHRLAEDTIDRMKTSAAAVPLVLVGGGSVLIGRELRGVSAVTVPPHAGVANAIGAAIAQVSGTVDRVFSYETLGRDVALSQAREEAIGQAVAAGAQSGSVTITEVEELPLQYLPGQAVRVRVKAVGDLSFGRAA
ncbi:MAG: hydantoinase/oxoprolinase family protein [Steroidobacteraceae bacterium]|jgi:N-methylhydantoinase A/oxoprolinase/acetone carboxylase beta subunit|nr:hydantoinase/oxoprolinase family protein [Steroidobacteraceae bacterium]